MEKLSDISLSGGLPLLAAAGVVLILAAAALWTGRFPAGRVRAFLAREDRQSIPVAVQSRSRDADRPQEPPRHEFDVGVSYREDPEEVIAILKTIGEELRRDPVCGSGILGPLEILGVDRFEDSAVIIRCRLTMEPDAQRRVGQEFTRRLDRAFKQHVIEIPFPRREIPAAGARDVRPLYVIVDDKESGGNGSASET